ncbi:MAG: putative sulfate exporter family transporter [Candidatus Faecousia sp.]|nr:putative sulfate exporter family transporter [Clostridiales bacterium]MDY6181468.1 putative sulfate exporter family transporter [Candidatus Faecousia sp.]
MNEKTGIMKWGKVLAIVLCVVIGVLANMSTDLQARLFHRTVIGGPMLALLVSMILCNLLPTVSKEFKEGTTYCSKQFLNWGIIATGGTLSFAAILGTGVRALPLILFNILLAFTVALLVGKKIGVTENTSILVGGGTCICGGTAIATLSRIIKAKESEIAFAMAAIFLFDTLAAFSYPYLIQALGFTPNQFAFVAGTAINDTSSVAGAQATYQAMVGDPDFQGALNVKLVRTTMLIFVALAWTLIMASRAKKNGEAAEGDSALAVVKKTFPMFILWFVVMAGLNTFGFFSDAGVKLLGKLGKYLFAAALAGVGFKIKFKDVFSKGLKPIALGGITWLCVAVASYAFAFLFAGYIG